MKQTAVEWLESQINQNLKDPLSPKFQDLFDQAKAMEKEQIIDAVNSQRQLGWDEKGTQYYNNNFQNK